MFVEAVGNGRNGRAAYRRNRAWLIVGWGERGVPIIKNVGDTTHQVQGQAGCSQELKGICVVWNERSDGGVMAE